MFSIGYMLIAAVDFAVLIWALKLCRRFPSNALFLSTAPLLLLWFDNFTIGTRQHAGRRNTPEGFEHRALHWPITFFCR